MSNTYPCLSKNFDSSCLERNSSSRASSSARDRSRAASQSSSGTHTGDTLPAASILARNSASLRSVFLLRSAGGLIIFDTAPTMQSMPSSSSLFARSNPVTPDS